ncbi:MAG: hypothetical protein AB1631_33430 [Acidobacteriota bacterium]
MNFCDVCNSTVTHRRSNLEEPYHYTESGLPNVYLVNVEAYRCEQCQSEIASIPRPGQLHILLVNMILAKPGAMTGDELRFVRKALKMTPKEFADLLAIHPQTIMDWQSAKSLSKRDDSLVRFVVAKLLEDKGELQEEIDIPIPAEISEVDWASTHKEIAELAETNTSLGIADLAWKLSSGEAH